MLERIVLTMGIASSTLIMEDLHRTGRVSRYKDLIAAFAALLSRVMSKLTGTLGTSSWVTGYPHL
jgi:hypothetical protein